MSGSRQDAANVLESMTLDAWRQVTSGWSAGKCKAMVLHLQGIINSVKWTHENQDKERHDADMRILSGLLRRQAIVEKTLRRKLKAGAEDTPEMLKWLDKEAKPSRRIF